MSVGADDLRASVYLRDDERLFRVVDSVQSVDGSEALVWLEDCATLAVEQFPVKALLSRGLERVIPQAP